MLLSLKWLKEFVPYEGTVDELAHRLTMIGHEVEEIIYPFEALKDVVVGLVLECKKHPQADKLSVCSVDTGSETLSIVCGAPNVAKGQKVAVAPVGTVLPEDFRIKKSKIRGVESFGMICAEDELGLGEDHEGIMVLDNDLALGTSLIDALNLDDIVFDIGVTPNRSDCMSVLGLARETAMAFDLPLTMPTFDIKESGPDAEEIMSIEVDDPELCPVYRSRIIKDISIKPSPAHIRYRLKAVGQRPISNIVDITNYIMFELGQPLHAFDLDLLEGGKIRVAPAEAGTEFVTLDDQKRKLTNQDLLIWDGKKPVALAGVMGGANSEIHGSSKHVLLESAVFKPASVRKTARRLGLPSEASFRFERGVDHQGSLFAANRAAAMIAEFGDGNLLPGTPTAEPKPWVNRKISFRPKRASALLGVSLDDAFCSKTIKGMGCTISDTKKSTWSIEAPGHRLDLEREVDIIEELGRVYGMDRIPTMLPHVAKSLDINPDDPLTIEYPFWLRIKHWARGLGLNETINYSFVGTQDLDILHLPHDNRIPVKNPLSEDQNVLRTELLPGLLHNVRHNLAQGITRLRFFEIAHVFHADSSSDTTASEPLRIGLLLYGSRGGEYWPSASENTGDFDYLDIKGIVEHLLDTLLPCSDLTLEFVLDQDSPKLDPCVRLMIRGKYLGYIGRVLPSIADTYHASKDIWVAELDADALMQLYRAEQISFTALPKFPPIRRDITVIAPETLHVGDIIQTVHNAGLKLLESVALYDVFIPEASSEERNLTFRLTFRHPEKTLKDKDADKEMAKVSKALEAKLPIRFQ